MPRLLLAAGAVLLAAAVALALLFHHRTHSATSVTVSIPATTAAATTTAPPPPPPPPPPPTVAMSWNDAGGLVVHPGDIDPAQLGQEMHDAGFGWVAVDLEHIDADWIHRFQLASGLAVGGWSVLGDDPTADAAAAVNAVNADALSFYIADAEAAYGYTFETTQSSERYARSRKFVTAFRASEPTLPAGVSSYCRADQHDLDWEAWANGNFVFLPQAYVNDFGKRVAPAACVRGAAKWFPAAQVFPTIGSYQGIRGIVQPAAWIALLRASPTTGFSIYPAEVGMSPENWQAYGAAISTLAAKPSP